MFNKRQYPAADGLTFVNNNKNKHCDVSRRYFVLLLLAAILSSIYTIHCAKLDNGRQIHKFISNEEFLFNEKTNQPEPSSRLHATPTNSRNLYYSELKRLSYENIYRILRDENEPLHWREEIVWKNPQKRSPLSLSKRSIVNSPTLQLRRKNLSSFSANDYQEKDADNILSIDLSENDLYHVDTTQFIHIRYLNLSYNRLTCIPLPENSSLISLNLNYNDIKSSAINFNLQLRELYLRGNQIQSLSSLNLSALPYLEILDLSSNCLQSLDTTFYPQIMRNLKMLNLAENHLISVYRETFYNLLNLNTLILSANNISEIDYESFLSLPNLRYLDLSGNRIKGKSIRALQGITGLEALSIAGNFQLAPYMQEFVASWSLKELDASATGLCQIPAALAQSVRSLKLTHNWLKIINCGDLDSYPLVQYLDLSFSHIASIEDDALGRLEVLEILMLDHNQLDRVPQSLPTSLEHLFLQNNQIMDLSVQNFQNLNNLQTLDLSNNKLLYLPALSLTRLQTLNLQNSEIKGISQEIVHSLPRLTDLMLEGNPLKCSDLLGIAEWASICRLPLNKDEQQQQLGDLNYNYINWENLEILTIDLKKKFMKMHNFYEQFEQQASGRKVNSRIPNKLEAKEQQKHKFIPSCVHQAETLITSKNKVFTEKFPKKNANESKIFSVKYEENVDRNPVSTITTGASLTATATTTIVEHDSREETFSSVAMKSLPEKINQTVADAVETTIKQQELYGTGSWQHQKEQTKRNSNNNDLSKPSEPYSDAAPYTAKTLRNATEKNTYKETRNVLQQQEDEQEQYMQQIIKIPTWFDPKGHHHDQHHDHDSVKKNFSVTTTALNSKENFNLTGTAEWRTQCNNNNNNNTCQNVEGGENENILELPSLTTEATETTATTIIIKNKNKTTTKTPSNEQPKVMNSINSETTSNAHKTAQITNTTTIPPTTVVMNSKMDSKIINILNSTLKSYPFMSNYKNIKSSSRSITTTAAPDANTTNKTASNSINTVLAAVVPQLNHTKKTFHTINGNDRNNNNSNNNKNDTNTAIATRLNSNKLIVKSSLAALHGNGTILRLMLPNIIRPTTITTTTTTIVTGINSRRTKTTTTINQSPTTPMKLNKDDEEEKKKKKKKNNGDYYPSTENTDHSNSAITATNVNAIKCVSQTPTSTTTSTYNIPECHPGIQREDIAARHAKDMSLQPTKAIETVLIIVRENNTTTMTSALKAEPGTAAAVTVEKYEQALKQKMGKDKHKHEPVRLHVKDRHLIGTPLLMHKGANLMVTADEFILPKNNNNNNNNSANSSNNTTNNNKHNMRQQLHPKNFENIEQRAAAAKVEHQRLTGVGLDQSQIDKPTIIILNSTTPAHHELYWNHTNKWQVHDEADQSLAHEKNSTQVIKANTVTIINEATTKSNMDVVVKSTKEKKKNNHKAKAEPSLIMKQMTIITTQQKQKQQQQQQQQHSLSTNNDNEVILKKFDNGHYHELKAIDDTNQIYHYHQMLKAEKGSEERGGGVGEGEGAVGNNNKHSTVNTPTHKGNGAIPHTFQQERDVLIKQQMLQQQQQQHHEQENEMKAYKTEHWLDVRKPDPKGQHSSLVLLVSLGLFVVLLLGLMHVYRCDMPWRRNAIINSNHRHYHHHHQLHHSSLRPHQHHQGCPEEDARSFLSYQEGIQKWHHSTRQQPPYRSPLHNLHVRELQKVSGNEKLPPIKTCRSANTSCNIIGHTSPVHNVCLSSSRNSSSFSSPNSTIITATNSKSSSTTHSTATAILDDDSFYIEMTPDSGHISCALHSELLPMELLNLAKQTKQVEREDNYKQTSMESENAAPQQQQYLQKNNGKMAPMVSSSKETKTPTAIATTTTTASVINTNKQLTSSTRKFHFW